MMKTTENAELCDFSLVTGGLLFRTYRRMHLSGEALELLKRRAVVITLIVWLPLLLLSMLSGGAFGGAVKVPFLHDVDVNARFLIALPLLIIADVMVHQRLGAAVRRFVERDIVVKEDLPRFQAAVDSARRVRDSSAAELGLLFLVYTLGHWVWLHNVASDTASWYARPDGVGQHLTPAGYWFAYVSVPIFQFILIRWYLRLVLWFWFLWQVSRLNLRLTAAHPDLAGGIGFLGTSSYSFAPILAAQGALLSGMIASRVLFEGETLRSFRVETAEFVFFFILCILGPLLMFTPKLMETKRQGSAEYGSLANRYIFGFENKWIRGGAPEVSELLGSGDIQSLADMGNSYSVIRGMRIVPFGLNEITRLVIITVAPLFPLVLMVLSVDELLERLVKTLL